ncbi:MAG TPA: HlyD family efflux transporter periplasmic adaptor subunit [Pyrinomonadaceae bacterium]|nr:HlyD family efflux transporter periplasmic adaptor subunit [Pyrinomonadaceae bacterium]
MQVEEIKKFRKEKEDAAAGGGAAGAQRPESPSKFTPAGSMDIPRNKTKTDAPSKFTAPSGTDVPRGKNDAPSKFTAPSGMDVARGGKAKRKKRIRLGIYAALGLVAIAGITYGLTRLKPAAPSVEGATLFTDTAKRGQMLRQVRGPGTLVPENVRVIAAATEGRVERINVQPGTEVTAGTVLLELSNPELEQSTVDIEYQVRAAEAEANNIRARLESERLSQQAVAANVRSEYQQAKLQSDTDEQLAKEGLIPALTLRLSRVRVEELANRYQIEQKRLEGTQRTAQAQLASQAARISQLKAQLQLRRSQVGTLRVLAGTNGVLQQMQVEVGQQVTPGTNLARVVEPQQLKAELRIAETQATGILLGMKAEIDTRNGVIPGHVSRIDPAAQNGTVTVDVALDGALPQGARPDLSVDGTIELERLDNVLYVGRPAFGQPNSTVSLFKLDPDGRGATRVQVKFGRASVNTIEVLEGLREGDRVILSDTSQWDSYDRIRLN